MARILSLILSSSSFVAITLALKVETRLKRLLENRMTPKARSYKNGLASFCAFSSLFIATYAFAQDQDVPKSVAVPMNVPASVPADVPTSVIVPMTPFIPATPLEAIKAGLAAERSKNWIEVRRLYSIAQDDYVKSALLWMIVIDPSSDATFFDFDKALKELNNYPGIADVRMRAEMQIDNSALSPQQKIEFLKRNEIGLKNNGPITGEGMLSLASALLATGQKDEAKIYISKAWRTFKFDTKKQANYLNLYQSYLTPEDFDKRVDLLIWNDRATQAKPLFPFMTTQGQINVNARLGIANEEGAVISGDALDDRGILYARVVNLRKQDKNAEALDLLLKINSNGLPESAQEDIWKERRILLIEALRTKRYDDAYKIVSQHGLNSGQKFADAEFVAGWISLRFLNNPNQALKHFTALDKAVETSMSKSRAYYWLGRTYEAQGDKKNADAFYTKALVYPTFYYGQLSAARLAAERGQKAILSLPHEARASRDDINRLNANPLMKIATAFSDMGERSLFVRFAFALDDTLKTNGEHQALSEYARSNGENLVGIRVAKAGLNRGIIATEAAFPIIPIPRIDGYHQAEDAFTLAITRQETEFNESAKSGAGALGLMQFLPATARSQANKMGIPHDTSWLISRPQHSLTLGSAHLADLVDRFNGSYVLAIISYNAGPGRSSQWIDTYGEIREVDADTAIDWVEMIPFSETRNYVQRVMENIQVYRARLNKDSAPIEILNDLTRGTKPAPFFKVNIAPEALQAPPEE